MKPLLKLEFRRALGCWTFWVSLGVGVVLAVIGAGEGVWRYFYAHAWGDPYLETSYLNQYAFNAFTQWLPNAVMQTTPNLFFFVAPLLIGFAYGWSWRSDMTDGYAASLLVRTPRKKWEGCKACATFISGGLLIAVPLLVNLVIVFCLVPAETPVVIDAMWNGVWADAFLSELFYCHPVIYLLVRFMLDFILAGLWATAVMGMSRLLRNRVAIVVLPYVAMLLFKYVSEAIEELLFKGQGVSWGELAIVDLLRVRGDYSEYTWFGVFFCIVVLAVVSLVFPTLARKRDIL